MPMTDGEVARMILESLALQLAALPESTWVHAVEAGCSPSIIVGLRSARDAFLKEFTEADLDHLSAEMEREIRTGLAQLDARRRR